MMQARSHFLILSGRQRSDERPNKSLQATRDGPFQFRFAVHAGWSRVPELWTLDPIAHHAALIPCHAAVRVKGFRISLIYRLSIYF